MNIRPDMIDGVRQDQQQDKTNRVKKSGADFGEFLNREVQGGSEKQQAQAVAPPPLVSPLLDVQQVSAVSAVSTGDNTAVAKVDGLVDSMEQYAATLGNPSASLKDAYGQLEQLSRDVEQVREQLPDLGQNAPDLNAVVNEVEALAATEQFKFNRGDYV